MLKDQLRHFKIIYTEQTVRLYSRFICLWVAFRYPNVSIGKNVSFYGKTIFRIDNTAKVTIGDNVTFRSATIHNFAGISKNVSIYVGKEAKLNIGSNTGLSGVSIFCSKEVTIGTYCNLGVNTNVWDTDFHPLDFELRRTQSKEVGQSPIRLENDVFVGANTTLLKGVKIGARSVIGAASVVTKSVPSDQIWAGNPARFIRSSANN